MNKKTVKSATIGIILLSSLGVVNNSYADHGDELAAVQYQIQTLTDNQAKLISELAKIKSTELLVTTENKYIDELPSLKGRNKTR